MAKIGLRNPYYTTVTLGVDTTTGEEIETISATPKRLAKAVQLQYSVNAPTVKLYADDGVAESVTDFIDGSGTATIDELEDTAAPDLYDLTVLSTSDDILDKDSDDTKYVRLGFIVKRIKGGVIAYRGIVLARVQFNIPTEQFDTKGEQIVLNTTQLPFNFYRNVDGVWRKRSPWNADFDTVSTWLQNVLKQTDLTVNPT